MSGQQDSPHVALVDRVGFRLLSTSTATDQLLLSRWRIIALCQFLLGGGGGGAEQLSVRALNLFLQDGVGPATDEALREAGRAVARVAEAAAGSVLPGIGAEKQREVRQRLKNYEELGTAGIERAQAVLPAVRGRLLGSPMGVLLAGTRYRLELVARLLTGQEGTGEDRRRAAAAILYVEDLHDAIPDELRHVGLLDDDFALRVVLEESGERRVETIHWTERIISVWDDLPFLQGVRLQNERGPIATTWLDRANAYVAYCHALAGADRPLVLVQPSVACSLLHAIVSLMGLVVLEGLTSSHDQLQVLEDNRVYEIDGQYYARYEGTCESSPAPGWLRLRFQDAVLYRPPTMANQMVAVAERRLSSGKMFATEMRVDDAGTIQRFFDWSGAIGAGSLVSRVLLVTSRRRATDLFGGIKSNGVSLLDDGFVAFSGMDPSSDVMRSCLVLVVPTLGVARRVLDQDIKGQAIVVDGYERLYHGRHDLPFLRMRESPPAVITWTVTGYCPEQAPGWLEEHRWLGVAADDLQSILELDGELTEDGSASRASLWEAVTASGAEGVRAPLTEQERAVLGCLEALRQSIRLADDLPDYRRYQLLFRARTLRTSVVAAPALWRDVREWAVMWRSAFEAELEQLTARAATRLDGVARALRETVGEMGRVTEAHNSKGEAVRGFFGTSEGEAWQVVCDGVEPVRVANRFLRRHGIGNAEAVLLRDLGVCGTCMVVGWGRVAFARRLAAHTPRRLVAVVDDSEAEVWRREYGRGGWPRGEALLSAVGHVRPRGVGPAVGGASDAEDDLEWQADGRGGVEETGWGPCVFVWLVDEAKGKVLGRESRALVSTGRHVREKAAHRIRPDDRVILGGGVGQWSPAEEFTESVMSAMESSSAELVERVREWRCALRRLREDRKWSVEELRERLKDVGVERELQTIVGWLDAVRPAPIGPQYLRRELSAMWPLVGVYTERTADEVATACTRLRRARLAAGRALVRLWEGRRVELGVEEGLLDDLVERLRREVHVWEVEKVDVGRVPSFMLGWWVSPELAERYGAEEGGEAVGARTGE